MSNLAASRKIGHTKPLWNVSTTPSGTWAPPLWPVGTTPMVEEEHPLGALDWTEPNAAGRVYRQVATDDPADTG